MLRKRKTLLLRTDPKTGLRHALQFEIPVSDWTLIRNSAIRRGLSVKDLVWSWMQPRVSELKPCEFSGDANRSKRSKTTDTTIRKQVTVHMPLRDWCLIRDHAARVGLSTAELARTWISPHVEALRKKTSID